MKLVRQHGAVGAPLTFDVKESGRVATDRQIIGDHVKFIDRYERIGRR